MRNINPKTNITQIDTDSFSRNKRLGSVENNLQYPESYIIKIEQNKCVEFFGITAQDNTNEINKFLDCNIDELG